MSLLRPRMAVEPPPEYVAFVGKHLADLRADAARVVGDAYDASLLYPDVLTEVAARWRWLELLRTRLGRPRAADRYLRRAFLRLAQRWQDGQLWPAELPPGALVEIEVWHDRPPAPRRVSAAVRLAPQLWPAPDLDTGPVAEAAVAWWHAYEAHRRRRYYLLVAVLLLGVAALARFVETGSG